MGDFLTKKISGLSFSQKIGDLEGGAAERNQRVMLTNTPTGYNMALQRYPSGVYKGDEND